MSTLMIMAGGTGGHVYPALAVADALRKDGVDVFWLGTRSGIEARVVPANQIDIEWVSIAGVKGKGPLAIVAAPFKIALAMLQTAAVIFRRRPAAVLGMGGFVAGPGGLAARLLMLPLVIHESNAVVGLTNKWLAKIATHVLVGFPGVLQGNRHQQYVGNPVRKAIAAIESPESRLAGRTGKINLLVVGGSLGAQVLNETVPRAIGRMAADIRPNVRHQAGRDKLGATELAYQQQGLAVRCSEFIEDMAEAYSWADVVICRSGAMTVAEIAAAGVTAIFVPYPYAIYDHQTMNARFLADQDAAILVDQEKLSDEKLAGVLEELANDRERILAIASSARRCAQPEATQRVAEICKEVLHA
jgi:UDP-N-acetylglucosamine--N-acetylmuramyl-(pentapeptide) pyrophosphoryl-undecaprenol N-acetylglucosamine transferase